MKATYAQLSITEGRHKVMRELKKGNNVTITATLVIEANDIINQMVDEDYVTDFTTGKIRNVKPISIK